MSGDATGVAEVAHSLKGSSVNVGAKSLGKLCSDIMGCARDGKLDKAKDVLPELNSEFKKVHSWYKEYMAKSGTSSA